jgi:hypothetical protein
VHRCLLTVACGVALFGCTSAPSAPSSVPSAPPSPFANIAGDYRLTIEIRDERCAARLPPPLRVRAYDVVLDDKKWHFLPVLIVGEGFGHLGGELWPPDPDSRYRFEWNNFDVGGCDYPEHIGSTELYVCGEGYGT